VDSRRRQLGGGLLPGRVGIHLLAIRELVRTDRGPRPREIFGGHEIVELLKCRRDLCRERVRRSLTQTRLVCRRNEDRHLLERLQH
jgi:hypothetical protein